MKKVRFPYGLPGNEDDLFVISSKDSETEEESYVEAEEEPTFIMEEMLLFPNPSAGKFTLSTLMDANETYSVKIYDNLGRSVYTNEHIANIDFDFDISNEAKGVYTIQITKKDIQYFRKLILQ
jgi:hypothetical protein